MAEVWEGHDENLDRAVAIKMLHGHLSGDAGFVSRFRREALSIAKLSHPNVVGIFDTGVDRIPPPPGSATGSTRAYIVMELIRGESLRTLLQKGLPMAKAVDIIRQAADGLAYAHRNGLVHRDVKPGNILVQSDGRVKVVDFGIAKLTDRRSDDTDSAPWTESATQMGEDLTQVGAILGTAKYLAPEQVEGGVVDARSDIYSLGVVLYEGVCGRPPFPGKNDLATALKHLRETPPRPRQIRPGIPRALETVITKAMSRRPAERYPSADDFSAALRAIDFTPDDATPAVSRGADDATPSTPVNRNDLPSDTQIPPKPPSGKPSSIPPRVLAAYDATTVSPNRARLRTPGDAESLLRDDTADGRIARVSGPDGPERPVRRPRAVRKLITAIAVAGLVLGSAAGFAVSSAGNRSVNGRALKRITATAYDPFGDDKHENDELAKDAIDGRLDTTWRTEGYRQRNFNGTKSGVGIIVRVPAGSSIGRLRVVSPSRGWSARVYVADSIPLDFSGWGTAVGSLNNVRANTTTVELTRTTGSDVLLWITQLSPNTSNQEFTRVIIQEISPRT